MNEKIKRLDLTSADGVQLNLDALYQIAPSCFTEARDPKTGELKRVVNFDALRQLLGDNAVDESRETYEFRWVGKDAAKAEAARPTDMTLRPVVKDSLDWDTTKNLYIEGDNLEVLKLLQRSYMGKVKMIYIDPPYNTGNDFVYHDDFAMSSDEYDEASGAVDELGNRYVKNSETSGRFHSDWCNMIYPRLVVARTLLDNDGAIFISIDEHEHDNLLKIMDEIFGKENYIDSIVWDKKAGAKGVPPRNMMVNVHEYIVAYQKTDQFKFIGEPRDAEKDGFKNPDNDPRGPWRVSNIKSTIKPIEEAFTITDPNTGRAYTNTWAFSKESLDKMIRENRILWKESLPKQKEFLYEMTNENKAIKSSWGVFDPQSTTVYLKKLIPEVQFDNPKPLKLMQYLISVASKRDALVLDFFSGSSTTADAIMRINADGARMRYIMVQIQELFDIDTEAFHAGYRNICDFAKQRIRRAGRKIKEEHPDAKHLDTGFRVFRLDDSNFNPGVKAAPNEYDQEMLDLFADNIKSDRTDLDLLFGSILAWGLQLDLPMTTEEVDGCKIYTVNDGDLVACFAEKVTDNVIEAMAEKEPLRVLFRDACFDSDDKKINLFETFKQKLDWTDNEAYNNIRVI